MLRKTRLGVEQTGLSRPVEGLHLGLDLLDLCVFRTARCRARMRVI